MSQHRTFPLRLIVPLTLGMFVSRGQCATPKLVDDRTITVHTARLVNEKRRALIQYLWGADGFPRQRMPDSVMTNVVTPVKHLSQLARVDEFRFNQAPDLEGLAYHFIPRQPNRQLVIVHHG